MKNNQRPEPRRSPEHRYHEHFESVPIPDARTLVKYLEGLGKLILRPIRKTEVVPGTRITSGGQILRLVDNEAHGREEE